jgi:hypothetical protein
MKQEQEARGEIARLVQPASVTQTFAILAVRGAGKTNAARAMAEAMFDLKLPFVAIDPVGSWWGLRASRGGSTPGLAIPVFGGRHGDIPLDVSAAVLLADLIVEKRLSCVLDLSTFASESEKKKFLLYFAQRLYARNEDPLHLFLEEADDYIPQKPFREEAQLLRAWENIVRRGRARGLGMTMITQRSAKINKDVLTQAETLIAMRTTSPQDRAAVEAWVKYHSAKAEILESLSSLEDGEAWVWSPHFLGDTFRMRFPLSRTFDSGATPKNARAGDHRTPATMADIDLGELRKKMEATLIKAKESDPAELKKEINTLRAELLKAGRSKVAPAAAIDEGQITRAIEAALAKGEKTWRERLRKTGRAIETAARSLNQISALTLEVRGNLLSAHRDIMDTPIEAIPAAVLAGPLGIDTATVQRDLAKADYCAPAPKAAPRSAEASGAGSLTASLRRVLTALAQHPDGMETSRLAALAGYTVNGHFNNLVGSLRSQEYITPARVFPIQITEGGLAALGTFEPLPTGEGLRTYWLDRVGPSKAKLLRALIELYPGAADTEQLAQLAGYTVNGHFNNLVGSLRTMGLITPPRQPIRAMDYFFEN